MRLHRSAPVLVKHHEVLLPAVQSCEQLLELVEAHLARVVPLVDDWLSFNSGRVQSTSGSSVNTWDSVNECTKAFNGYVEHCNHDPACLQAECCEEEEEQLSGVIQDENICTVLTCHIRDS